MLQIVSPTISFMVHVHVYKISVIHLRQIKNLWVTNNYRFKPSYIFHASGACIHVSLMFMEEKKYIVTHVERHQSLFPSKSIGASSIYTPGTCTLYNNNSLFIPIYENKQNLKTLNGLHFFLFLFWNNVEYTII